MHGMGKQVFETGKSAVLRFLGVDGEVLFCEYREGDSGESVGSWDELCWVML